MAKATHLLDSDVIIWILRGRKETVKLLGEIAQVGIPSCSPISIIEVLIGVKPGEEELTCELLRSLQVIPIDRAIAEKAAEYIRKYQDKKHPDFANAIIAATAVVHNLTLVTHNKRHYPMSEIRLYP